MHPDVQLAMELQTVDREILRLSTEVAYLPRHIQEIENKLAGAQARLEADRKALADNQKERKKLEGDVAVVETKVSKYKDQMHEVKTNEQYKAFQHEISFAEQEIGRIEDKILERMLQAEELEGRVKKAEKQLASERAEVDREKTEAMARTRADEAALVGLRARRNECRARITPAALGSYDHLHKSRKGTPVAEVRDGACSECNVRLRPQHLQEVKVNDVMQHCETCARILYYVPPPPSAEEPSSEAQSASNSST